MSFDSCLPPTDAAQPHALNLAQITDFPRPKLAHPPAIVRGFFIGNLMKIALIVGHNARSQGAVRVTDRRSEFDWCGDLAAAIAASAPALYRVFRRPAGLSYSAEIRQSYAPISKSEFAGTIELHFNGAASPAATGTETLTSGTLNSQRLARLIQPAMVSALGLRDRGLVIRKRGERGGESLWAGAPPAILIEPYFGSNPSDCAAADRHFSALVRAIHGACVAHLKRV